MHFLLTSLVLFAVAFPARVAGRALYPGRVLTRSSDLAASYDFVVVGGGTSGLVVARRLTKDKKTTVLVIEAGVFDQKEDFVTIPLISSGNVPALGNGPRGSRYDWNVSGIPQIELHNRSIAAPAGKVIGGSSVLNGMVFNRGSKADYDRWERLGNPGWGFESLLRYFKKSEIFTPPTQEEAAVWNIGYNPAYHGTKGHVHSSYPPFVWPSTRNYINSMKELGIPIIVDSMGGNATGAFWYTLSLDPQTETRSTSEGFYTPERPNLHLLTGHHVLKLVTTSRNSNVKVIGVDFSSGEGANIHRVLARKEVILTAGALHTPQILQLSGIGDPAHLSALGIECIVDLPGVGANYQDHPLLVTAQIIDVAIQTANFSNATWSTEMRALYNSKRQGPYTTVGGSFFAFLPLPTFTNNSRALLAESVAQSSSEYLAPGTHPTVIAGYTAQRSLLNQDFTFSDAATMEFIFGDTIIIPGLQHPFSRGSVRINSTSPFVPPVIDPRYISNPLDIASFIAAFKFVRTIRATKAFQEVGATEVYPGGGVQSDSEIEEFIRNNVNTLNHHAGTASMLPREMGGVVDSKLKVWGVDGLRVADASIIPLLPASHLQTSVYAIAEKAAHLIKASH